MPPVVVRIGQHAEGTELAAKNIDAKTTQTLLGHSNIQTTLQLYAEAVEENMRAAVDEITADSFNEDDYMNPRTPEEVAAADALLADVIRDDGYY